MAKVTVNVVLEDCTGTFYITDIMFQEGEWLTGYVVNNLEFLQKKRVDGEITPVRFFNGLVRSGVTAVIINDGEVSAGLNYHIIPKDAMVTGDMSVAHNYGSHKLTMQSAFSEDDSDVEESSTRSEDISMDYDFFHSHEMELECGSDYEIKVVPHDPECMAFKDVPWRRRRFFYYVLL